MTVGGDPFGAATTSGAVGAATTIADLGEAALIAAVVRACPTRPPPEGPGDDAALIPAGPRRVLTIDALVEGTHFLRAHPPALLGLKALAVNLSDVAAMGAEPEAFALAAALPPDLPTAWWRAFAEGLGAYATAAGVHLAGGDTVRANGPLTLTITAWGLAPDDRLLLRSGGRPGDVLMVHGPIGRAGRGLETWLSLTHAPRWPLPDGHAPPLPTDDACLRQHLAPEPPLWAGPWALAHGATAGMDLSDGLATDLPRLAAASGLALAVDLERLPPDPALAAVTPHQRAAWGEDYSLVVLVPEPHAPTFEARGFSAIGRALPVAGQTSLHAAPGVIWRLHGREVDPVEPGFHHFGSSD